MPDLGKATSTCGFSLGNNNIAIISLLEGAEKGCA